MHPLLLFTFLFIPGIKTSQEVIQDVVNVKRKVGGSFPVSETDVVPIEEPQTIDMVNPRRNHEGKLKPYQSHIAKNFETFDHTRHNEDLNRHHEFSNFKGKDEQGDHTPHDYKSKRILSKIKAKYLVEKGFYNPVKHSHKPESVKSNKSRFLKKYETFVHGLDFGNVGNLVSPDTKSNEAMEKEEPAGAKDDYSVESLFRKIYAMRKKPSDEFSWNNFKNGHEKHMSQRFKRQTDSSESEDEDYNGDDEDESDEVEGFSSVEKRIIPSIMAGTDDDTHPYEDTIEIKLKEKQGEMIPVIEDKITKTTAYVSCGRGGGPGCGEDQDIGVQHEYDVHAASGGQNKKQDEDSEDYHIDMAAWLKAFEEEIINHGVNVRYNHE